MYIRFKNISGLLGIAKWRRQVCRWKRRCPLRL